MLLSCARRLSFCLSTHVYVRLTRQQHLDDTMMTAANRKHKRRRRVHADRVNVGARIHKNLKKRKNLADAF